MDRTLRDFIAARKLEIKEQLRALKQEWRELQAAESVISNPVDLSKDSNGLTIKEMIVKVLEPNLCADAYEIMRLIKEKFGIEIQRTSMSPQLSRLKNENVLYKKNNNFWCLAGQSEALKNETPDVAASDVSNVGPLS